MAKQRIKFEFEGIGIVEGEVVDEENPSTAKAILNALPIKSVANRWGEEVYFSTNISISEERAKQVVDVGDIAFWPPGNAICLFFGPTPVSKGNEPRAFSPVNVFGKVVKGLELLKKVKSGTKVMVSKA
jgi:hypothetical protein